jgi:hypothetical protein
MSAQFDTIILDRPVTNAVLEQIATTLPASWTRTFDADIWNFLPGGKSVCFLLVGEDYDSCLGLGVQNGGEAEHDTFVFLETLTAIFDANGFRHNMAEIARQWLPDFDPRGETEFA